MTPTELKARLNEMGILPKRSLGQNFLVSADVVNRILAQVEKFQPEHVIEIGPGVGALTERLLEKYPSLRLLEMDDKLAEYWRHRGADVLEGDALRAPWGELIRPRTVLISNLPYQISATLVMELSTLSEGVRDLSMVLMFQKEVAERIQSPTQCKDYGILSIVAQNIWDVRKVADASARCFYPAPKVSSRVLSFTPRPDLYASKAFLKFVKAGFQNRRKLLTKSLNAMAVPGGWESVLQTEGFSSTVRAEEVTPAQWRRLHQIYVGLKGSKEP